MFVDRLSKRTASPQWTAATVESGGGCQHSCSRQHQLPGTKNRGYTTRSDPCLNRRREKQPLAVALQWLQRTPQQSTGAACAVTQNTPHTRKATWRDGDGQQFLLKLVRDRNFPHDNATAIGFQTRLHFGGGDSGHHATQRTSLLIEANAFRMI